MSSISIKTIDEPQQQGGAALRTAVDARWRWVYRIAAVAALLAVFIFRRNIGAEIALFGGQTPPVTAGDWFALLHDNVLLGLTFLDFFDLLNYALLGGIFVALYGVLRQTHKIAMRVAVGLGLFGVVMYFASNQAFGMWSLSEQYAVADEAHRISLLAAGEARLAINNPAVLNQSAGLYLSLFLVTLASLMMSVVMLRSAVFSRATAYLGILAHGLVLTYFLMLAFAPSLIALPHSAAAMPLVLWEFLIAQKLFQLTGDASTEGLTSRPALRTAVAVLGVYAGFLGMVHGGSEMLQGGMTSGSVFIQAIGAPCQPETVWHACLPAMTLIPSFHISGLMTINLSIFVGVWAVMFIQHRHGALVLFLLSIILILVGGGFIPAFHGIVAAGAATQLNQPVSGWRTRRWFLSLRALWPWILILYLVWVVSQTLLGDSLNAFLLGIGFAMMPIELIVVILSVLSALACDLQKAIQGVHAPSLNL